MSQTLDPPQTKALHVDPGCLPAWDVDEMPEPAPFLAKNWLKLIGPGLVLAGGSIGTGELILGPQVAARYHGAMMWVVVLSILAQVVLNTEVMRYTLCTGEPIMTGFMRCKPGPRFWLGFYFLLDFGGWLPTLAALAAQVIVVAARGLGPADSIDENAVRQVSYVVFLCCAAMSLFGGKVYNTVQFVIGGKFLFVLFYMLACTLFFVSASTWMEIWGGIFDVTRLPRDPATGQPHIDWGLVAAMAGFSGVGGLGNIMVSNFVREKGWGMASKVGAIPSAFGGHQVTLSHLGTMARPSTETNRRFKGWFKYLIADQYAIWALGSLIGIMLPCLMGAQYLKVPDAQGNVRTAEVRRAGTPPPSPAPQVNAPRADAQPSDREVLAKKSNEQWRWAAALAQDFGAAKGDIFRYFTLFCALVILIPGQFYVIDGVARRWTDAVWSGSARARLMDVTRIKHLYYSFAALYVTWGLLFFTFFGWLSGSSMMIFAGNLANFSIFMTICHTFYVNRRFLPKEMQPSPAKQAALVAAALFFLTMFALVVNQKLIPMFFK
jgi:hypothetical protein